MSEQKVGSFFGATDNPATLRSKGSYANPHATIAIQDIPIQLKQLFRLLRYYYCTDALSRAIIQKMSEYPITDVIVDDTENRCTPKTLRRWKRVLDVNANIRQTMININVDKIVYGNSFHYVYLPFIRYAKCGQCSNETPLKGLTIKGGPQVCRVEGKFSFTVHANCPKCQNASSFSIIDRRSTATTGLKMVRMNPLRMDLEYNPQSAERQWYWIPPSDMRDQFLRGVRVIVDTTEMKVLEALMNNRKLKLNPERLWVAQAETMPGIWEGWGFPPFFPALEDIYYYKILRRANEALAQEHITPLRFLTPAMAGESSAQRSMNLASWQSAIRSEIQRFKRDPNHIVVTPVPLNVEQMGGNARVMMVAAEMEAAARIIAAAIGCPLEMILGGLNWSGGNVSLRVLENHFLNERQSCERLFDFLVPLLARHFRLPLIQARLSDFKMADDAQRAGNAINLMLQGFASRKSTLPEMGLDAKTEFENLKVEHDQLNAITMQDNLAAAHMQMVVQSLQAKASILLQYELQVQQAAMAATAERKRLEDLSVFVQELHQRGLVTPLEFDQSAQMLATLPPQLQSMVMATWGQTMPMVTRALMQKMQSTQTDMAAVQQAMSAGGQGAQSFGAASGPGLQPGAAGPFGGPQSDGAAPDAGNPQPEVLPPRSQP